MSFDLNNVLEGCARALMSKAPHVPVVGIDIGTSSIKAVVIASAGPHLELTSWAVEPIMNGNVKAALEQILLKTQQAGAVPVTAVSGKGTLIRYVDLPRMPLEDLRKSFAYDMDKYFPFDPQSIYTDCFILDQNAKDKRMPVLVAAVKKELIDERMKLFKEAGTELSHITINSIATANAFERLGAPLLKTDNAKAVLDIGGSVSTLLVIKDRSPRFTRDIFIGSQEMTRQIANNLGIDAAQAERLKCVPGGREKDVLEACDAALNHLSGELRLSLDYFMTEKNVQIDEFFLVGGGSMLSGIESFFEKNLGMSVRRWDPLAGLGVKTQGGGDLRAFSSQLCVAVGLGLTKV